ITFWTGWAQAFTFWGGQELFRGYRWDAAPRREQGQERSLDGGLRYSMQGGSYQTFRDQLSWLNGPPSDAEFQQAVENAFHAWTVVDPATNLGTTLSFVPDFATPVNPGYVNFLVRAGAEIDIFAAVDGSTWNPGDRIKRAETFVGKTINTKVTLTSGTTGYTSDAITGVDIYFNSNPQALYTPLIFQTLLTHEIGHALGLGDVDIDSPFIDDNYDGSTSATALATLTNSFANLINPLNPALSPLDTYFVANGDPGVDTAGVDILMETLLPIALFVPGVNPLSNDDFAGRQFLYPTFPVPEPCNATIAALGACAAVVVLSRRRYRAEISNFAYRRRISPLTLADADGSPSGGRS
ncbi:MAG: hypothetical protein IT427_04670, partial [Pirellulales bacterium]|nr:hypothetical protein [Pirellulales bacterium]